MKFILILILGFAFFNLNAQTNSYTLAIKNVSVITMPAATVQVTNLYITENGESISSSKNFTSKKVIDGSGKFLMPGLTDMHVHFPTTDQDRFFKLLTAAGITNCRIMKSDNETISYRKMHDQP